MGASVQIHCFKVSTLKLHQGWVGQYAFLFNQRELKKVDRGDTLFFWGRVLTAITIAKILHIDIKEVIFVKGKYGKPFLRDNDSIYFNLSKSRNMVVLAVTTIGRIGVDVEFLNEKLVRASNVAFTTQECKYIEGKEYMDDKKYSFYFVWTRKEAVLKMLGKGFYLRPDTIEVPLNCDKERKYCNVYMTFAVEEEYIISAVVETTSDHCDVQIEQIFQNDLVDKLVRSVKERETIARNENHGLRDFARLSSDRG